MLILFIFGRLGMLRYVEAGLVKAWQVWLVMERLVAVCLGKECFGRQGVLRYRLVLACYVLVGFGRHG